MANLAQRSALANEAPRVDRSSKENRWYFKELGNHLPPSSRKLLEDYSSIPAEDVESHIYKMRESLWSSAPYPCIGSFKFITLYLPKHPLYTQMLALLQSSQDPAEQGPYFLDLGCCVGQELRSLALEGIPSQNLYGSDIIPSYLSKSYILFNDAAKFKGNLVSADIFSPTLFSDAFNGWENKFRVVHAGLFLHLFSYEQQVMVCKRVIKLLSEEPGSVFLGENAGCLGGGERTLGSGTKVEGSRGEKSYFLHDDLTFSTMWDVVARDSKTEGKWKVDATFRVWEKDRNAADANGGPFFVGNGIGWLNFSVERV